MSGRNYRAAMPVQRRVYALAFCAGTRTFELKLPRTLWMLICVALPLLGLFYFAATIYWMFHDDLLTALMRRQVDMQYAYEDRIGALRHEVETVTLRARSEEARFTSDLQKLTAQQSQAESRTALLLALSERMKTLGEPKGPDAGKATSAKPPQAQANPLLSDAFAPPLPPGASAYAPLAPQRPAPSSAKPRPEPLDLRLRDHAGEESRNDAPAPTLAAWYEPQSDLDVSARLSTDLTAGYERLDAQHARILANFFEPANRMTKDVRAALAAAGLSADQFAAAAKGRAKAESNVGGPFEPLRVTSDGSSFARSANLLETALDTSVTMARLVPLIPLRRPLPGPIEITSGFGPRVDPFLGRAAMHTGVDLLDEYGAAVHATAKGVVTIAGPNGGYGNMVEIDHGNGLTTRYAHLSAIDVVVDQKVEAGAIVGRVGSTGRSTGPHLHYETRIGGEAVDPVRFLRAGALLFGDLSSNAACSFSTCAIGPSAFRDQ
jgi:murein DD-endopeptidase MepM/ murein hydrolase activator NlpD